MKKTILLLVSLVFLAPFHFAFAGLVINEIMYDLSGSDSANSKSREWIEIYNSDSAEMSLDASKWRVYDGSANRTINGEVNFSIPAGAYIIFAGDKDTFLSDHAGFAGTVYDTGITSLNNTGAALKILDQDGVAVNSVTYASSQGGAGDGNSLQLLSNAWAGAVPSPGQANESSALPPPATSDSSSSTSSPNSPVPSSSPVQIKIPEQKIKVKITAPAMAFAGLPLSFEGMAFGYNGEPLFYGKYFWNFGDGDSREVKLGDMKIFNHTYFYPGEYAVSLEYYTNNYAEIPDALDRIILKVAVADVMISRVGDEKDFFVELANNANYDIDISNWILWSEAKSFTLPKNTIIGPKKQIIISSKITNFSLADKNTLKLMTSQGEVAFDYPASVAVAQSVPAKTTVKNTIPAQMSVNQNKNKNLVEIQNPTLEQNLPASPSSPRVEVGLGGQASAVSSDVIPESSSNSYLPMFLSFAFIGASAGAVYFIRQRKILPGAGDDFNILNE